MHYTLSYSCDFFAQVYAVGNLTALLTRHNSQLLASSLPSNLQVVRSPSLRMCSIRCTDSRSANVGARYFSS